MYAIIKLTLSAFIIFAASELAKRSIILGALIASLPLTSLLALSWLYYETKNVNKVAALTTEIFWLVLPSLIFFVVFPILLRAKYSFASSMCLAIVGMLAAYGVVLGVRRGGFW